MSMEATENKCAPSTHQKKAKKLKKLRRWQITVSLLAIAVMGWGVIQVVCLFLNYKRGKIASIVGRFYAMDRDKRWERVKVAYDLLVNGEGKVATDMVQAMQESYDEGVTEINPFSYII